jgi:hypothetical protein
MSVASRNVFRAALFSIVLTLATGQNAALFCGVWCHSDEKMAGTCEHSTAMNAAAGIDAIDRCPTTGNTIVFVGDDARRSFSTPDANGAVPVPVFTVMRPSGAVSISEPSGRLLESRPLVLALRI